MPGNPHVIHVDEEIADQVVNDENFHKKFAKCLICLEMLFEKALEADEDGVLISIQVQKPK